MDALVKHLPEHLQLQILSHVTTSMNANPPAEEQGPRTSVETQPWHHTLPPPPPALQDGLAQLRSDGFAVVPGVLGSDVALGVRGYLQGLEDADRLHQAGVSAGANRSEDPSVRGDRITWLHEKDFSSDDSAAKLGGWFHHVGKALEDEFGAHVHDMRTMAAVYPGGGARYVRHRDSSPLIPHRRVTMLYYLNSWKDGDGGELRLYKADGGYIDVQPRADTTVIFFSDMEHEVMPSHAWRGTITAFFYSRQDIHAIARDPPVITASIISYRDGEVSHTLQSLLANARMPGRIRVVLYAQNNLSNPDHNDSIHVPKIETSRKVDENTVEHNVAAGAVVRVRIVPHSSARGPCVARAVVQEMMQDWVGCDDNAFYLQVDSHMRFAPGWDTYLTKSYHQCRNERAVLTAYPPPYEISADGLYHPAPSHELPTAFELTKCDKDGMPRWKSVLSELHRPAPTTTMFWAAGMSFSKMHSIKFVPYDRNLQMLFFGEEISMAVRLWTHGYDFFTPGHSVVYHCWSRQHRPSYLESHSESSVTELRSLSIARVRDGIQRALAVTRAANTESSDLDIGATYGCGTRRNAKEYAEVSGVDLANVGREDE